MRAALLISGYLRSFKLNYPNLREKILNQFENIDIYIHITENEKIDDKYLNYIEDISNIKDELNPICIMMEPNVNFFNDKIKNNIFNNFFKFYKLNKIKSENEIYKGYYDIVIKYRPDLNIFSDYIFDKIENDLIYIPIDSKIDKNKLKNSDDKYLSDTFAYGTSKMMNKYFDIFNKLYDISEEHGNISETLLYHYLNDSGIKYKLIDLDYNIILSMCNVFAICGDSGTGKSTLGELLKNQFSNSFMLECDRYHKWERGDKNWNKFTHLNPESNFISKMEEDIFNLKIGNHIYQVDYDHKTGKFTDMEKINSDDNIIVCGLHSLYNNKEDLYNLKIFMDTDVNLKKSWKIKRDMKKRGYTYDKIIEQISNREKDFLKYIYPQRNKSDIIVNFFTNDEIDLNNIDKELKVSLRLYISKKYSIDKILIRLNKKNINMQFYSDDDNYNEIVFNNYEEVELTDISKNTNNFYDYILFFILNMNKQV